MSSFFRRAGAQIAKIFSITSDPPAASGQVSLYAKDVAGTSQLFAEDGAGVVSQLSGGSGGGVTLADGANPLTSPTFVAISPNGTRAYILNNSGSIAILALPTLTVAGFVPVDVTPVAAVVTPDSAYVYVLVRTDSSSVAVLRASDNTIITTIPVGAGPAGIVMAPDGSHVYVLNLNLGIGVSNVSVIRTSDNTVVTTVNVQPFSVAIGIQPIGAHVYVTSVGDPGGLTVIDTATNAVVTFITAGLNGPSQFVFSPDSSLIYLLDSGMPIVSTATNTVVGGLTGLGTYPELLSITPNGSFLYITNSTDHTVSVVRTSDNTTIATVPLGNHATSISAAPDSTAVYVTTASNTSTDAVVVIRTSDNTVIASPAIGSGTANQAVTPDGSLVLLPAYNTDRALWILTTSTETAEEWVPSTTVGTFSTLLLDGIKATNLGSGLAGFSGPTFLRQPPTPTPPPANSNFLGMAVTTDGAFVYVGNTSNSGTPIYVFRTSDNKWVDTIPAGVGPSYLCAHPDGTKIYASNYYDNTVSVIDTATRTVTATISFLSQPQGLVCSPDGSILYVANFGANNIQPINTTTLALSPTIATDSLPQNMCITPDGAHLYVTNSGTTAIQVIRTSDGTVIANFTSAGIGAAHGIAVTPDGTKVYVNVFLNAPPYGGVLDITVASNTVAATIVIGDGHSGLAVTPDGAHVYALNAYSSSISVIRTSDNTVVATISLFTSFSLPFIVGPQYIVINPAGTFAYVNGQMESPAPTALIDVIHLTNNTLYTSVSSFVTPPVINNGTYSQYQLDGAALTNLGDGRVDIRLPVVFNDADPTVHTNLQNGGDQPSPIDNLQAGVVNLGSQTGNWNPNALGAIGSYSTIGGGADNQAGPTGYETISGGAGNTANGNSAVIGGGYNNQVNADYATVGGGNSNHATNEGATVGGGEGNQAGGFCATISGGSGNQAKGSYAYAEGLNVNSDGEASHAEGDGTGSQGHASHTEGLGTFAEGEAAHAEGVGTQANSRGAHAEGNATTAQNNYAHTEGDGTNAEGLAAHAEGQNTLAYANYSHAAGIGSASPYEGSYTHSSGPGSTYNNGNQPTSGGATQHSVLTMAGQTPGVAVGESVVLDFGQSGGDYIQFSRFNSYPGVVLVVTAIARSGTDMAPVVRAFRQMFVGWGNGSSLHLSASGVQESIGDASTASWTLTGAITAPFGQDCFTLTFTTGADTAAVVVTAKVEMVEVSNFPSS